MSIVGQLIGRIFDKKWSEVMQIRDLVREPVKNVLVEFVR